MNDTHAKRDLLWKLIADAQAESDHARANSIFYDAEQLARHLHGAEPNDAEHCYAIALTYYHRWGTPLERGKCIDWLQKTKKLDPTHPWVPLYLGYQFMDEKRYAEAYIEFDRVNQDYFASRELHWRNIKTDELMLVALILGGSSPVDFTMLVHLADRYAEAAEIDQPVPTEIVKVLADSSNRERFTVPAERVASEVCRLIRACGDVNLFPDELAVLDSAAKAIG